MSERDRHGRPEEPREPEGETPEPDGGNPLKHAFLGVAAPVEAAFDSLKWRLAARFGRRDPVQILPYRGYGTAERLFLHGRVLEDERIGEPGVDDSALVNLANMWKRFESDEWPHARVRARGHGRTVEVTADQEGHFFLQLEPAEPLPTDALWHSLELELLEPDRPGARVAVGEVLVPPPAAEYGVISDLDDTVLETGVTQRLLMARTVFLRNAHTRLPFAGVAGFYRALHRGRSGCGCNPIFYVSGSPWNLYDLLAGFLELHDIPRGPLLLRDFGLSREKLLMKGSVEHKRSCIRAILETYPHLPFLLIGDSGEQDPEIYREVVRSHPGRILGIYIRRVGTRPERDDEVRAIAREVRERGTAMLLVEDTEAAAVHAAEAGWILREEVSGVREEKARDEADPTPAEAALRIEG
jgi:phosphatidate phosphatase APP1